MRVLIVEATDEHVRIRGSHFHFAVRRTHGLIDDIQIKDDRWIGGFLPDLWASPEVHPGPDAYFARYCASASLDWRSDAAGSVRVRAKGRLANRDGRRFPLTYEILYEFHVDGTVKVVVRYQATEEVRIRWLTLCGADVLSTSCRFLSREADLDDATATCRPVSRELAAHGGKPPSTWSEAGRFIPWWHFGNDHTGIEFVFPHSNRAVSGWTDSSPHPTGDPLGQAGDLFTCVSNGNLITLTSFLVRNVCECLAAGAVIEDACYVSVVPGRTHDPRADDMRVAWIGPHQFRPGWSPPDESVISAWVDQGVNWVIGGVNWRSGDYRNPDAPPTTERFLEQCHRRGLKVMPYVTFSDMEYGAPGFDEHGRNWRIEPVSEFNYRSQLMCYGAPGWRARWKDEIDGIFGRFPFDGLYIDFWAGRLACRNARHGCVGPFGRFTAEGLRDMARHAYDTVKTSTPDGLILANTNVFPLAMINNWFDARLYGEWHNLEQTEPLSLRVFYNSRRFGTGSVLLLGRVPEITRRTVALAEVFQGSPVMTHARNDQEKAVLREHAMLKREFGVAESVGWNHFELQDRLGGSIPPNLRVSLYYHPERADLLISLSTTDEEQATVRLDALTEAIAANVLGPNGYPLPSPLGHFVWDQGALVDLPEAGAPGQPAIRLTNGHVRHVWIKRSELTDGI